ncbi:glutathione S-transferase family protein [Prosthecomicrobium sp. N25]|uniref:glutathione S-transferase family protein n=1 Tax=Prosthecomicrobium sp. N25 TaxID=3129254 RepID=UPI003076FED6
MLVKGKWAADWQPVQGTDAKGGFVRQTSSFRHRVTPGGETGFPAEAGRYHLYVALICPWASRTLIARRLKGLEAAVSVDVVEPALSDQGWRFPPGGDHVNGVTHLHELYTRADPAFTGRATVPILWDKATGTIVNNESADILRILDEGFGALASGPPLRPADIAGEVDALGERMYPALNNGVYRAGFATTQDAYEEAYGEVFAMLDELEARLAGGGPFLFGDRLTEADIRLFVTLVRFDAAYHGLFKCNRRRIADYPALSRHIEAMLDVPGVAGTVSIAHIKRGYYSIKALNPKGIVPLGPDLPFADRLIARPGDPAHGA